MPIILLYLLLQKTLNLSLSAHFLSYTYLDNNTFFC